MAAAAVVASPARAGCDNHSPDSDTTVTCTAAVPNPDFTGVSARNNTVSVAVNVDAGATVQTDRAAAVDIVSLSTVVNRGRIQSNRADAVTAAGDNLIMNFGIIQGLGRYGVDIDGGFVTNGEGATIHGADAGVRIGDISPSGAVVNDGEIRGDTVAIVVDGGAEVRNNATGVITGDINVKSNTGAQVLNAGTIAGAITFAGNAAFTLTNAAGRVVSGLVSMTGNGAVTVMNDGVLLGGLDVGLLSAPSDPLTARASRTIVNGPGALINSRIEVGGGKAADTVDNAGDIAGVVHLGGGNDTFTNRGAGTIGGDARPGRR